MLQHLPGMLSKHLKIKFSIHFNFGKDMKINTLLSFIIALNLPFKELYRIMRISFFLLFIFVLHLQATNTHAQNAVVNLNSNRITIGQLIKEIESQTEYLVVFRNREVDTNKHITVSNRSSNVAEYLKTAFANTDVAYHFENNYIILTQKAITAVDQNNQRKITGVIMDALKEPMIGVNVVEKGTGNGTITNIDGEFTLNVQEGAVVQISYIGYITQEIVIGNQTRLNVHLREDATTLDEVVVVGFGVQRKENLTGAVSQIKMEEVLGDRPVVNAVNALQGAIPGLTISGDHDPNGSDKKFQIRGAYSLGNSKIVEPLILIDNVEGSLDMLNPDDIESVTVLKDAASAAIYGARAAGGVIIVTTKQPKKNTDFRLNYNNNFGFETAISLPKQTDLDTYFGMYLEAGLGEKYWAGNQDVAKWREYLKDYKKNPGAFQIMNDGLYRGEDGAIYYLNEHDIYKQFMETSSMMNHNISASGGTEKLRYRISGGYSETDGPLITNADKYKRLNVSTFLSADVTDWFTQVVDIKYSQSNKTMPGNSSGNLYNTRLLSYYPEGTIGEAYGLEKEYPVNTPRNTILYGNNKHTKVNNPRIFLKSIVKPFKNFEAVFEYTFDKRDTQFDYYSGQYTYTDIQQGLSSSVQKDEYRKHHYYTDYNAINVYGTYDLALNKHTFKLMGGFNQESSYYESVDISVFSQTVQGVPSLSGTTDKSQTTQKDEYEEFAIRGGFFRFNYNYDSKYLLEVNGRYDGSSRFPKKNRFGFFPSVSVGWQLGRENFMSFAEDWLDELKIRASWGKIGNQNVTAYAFNPLMTLGLPKDKWQYWLHNDSPTNVIGVPSMVRDNYTWEKVATTDIGLDIVLLNGRLRGTFDWYQRDTKGMLAPGAQLPAVVGSDAPYQNTANMVTHGWELAISWRDRIGKVGYNVGFNIFDARTKVTKYSHNQTGLIYEDNTAEDSNRYRKEMYLGEIWGYVFDGFYTVDDFEDTTSWKLKEGVTAIDGYNSRLRPGDIKFKNLSDADGTTNTITEGLGTAEDPGDRKIIGNNTPRYNFGINLGANYAGFDLSIFLQGVAKRDVWLKSKAAIFPFNGAGPTDAMFCPVYYNQTNYWQPKDPANGDYTPIDPNPELPRIYDYTVANSVGSNTRRSDKYLQNAAYMRVKNVTLSYNFPKQWIRSLNMSQLRVFASAENLFTFTSLPKGYDPETVSWNYPLYRTISFGLNVTF